MTAKAARNSCSNTRVYRLPALPFGPLTLAAVAAQATRARQCTRRMRERERRRPWSRCGTWCPLVAVRLADHRRAWPAPQVSRSRVGRRAACRPARHEPAPTHRCPPTAPDGDARSNRWPYQSVDKVRSKHQRHSILSYSPTQWSICGMPEAVSGVYQRAVTGSRCQAAPRHAFPEELSQRGQYPNCRQSRMTTISLLRWRTETDACRDQVEMPDP